MKEDKSKQYVELSAAYFEKIKDKEAIKTKIKKAKIEDAEGKKIEIPVLHIKDFTEIKRNNTLLQVGDVVVLRELTADKII